MESDVFQDAFYSVGFRANDKLEALTAIVQELYQHYRLPRSNIDHIVSELAQRETLGSTGIGNGFAIPHAMCDVPELMVGFFLARHGLDFDSIDETPVYLLVPVLAPAGDYLSCLEALVQISRLFKRLESADRLARESKSDEELRRIVVGAAAATEELSPGIGDIQAVEGEPSNSSVLEIYVNSVFGLHGKPSAAIFEIANCFDSRISIVREGNVADAKDFFSLMALAVTGGEHRLTLYAVGPDASEAVRALADALTHLNDSDHIDRVRRRIKRTAGREDPSS